MNNTGDSINAPLVDVQHVSYIYPAQKTRKSEIQSAPALQDVSLQVHAGEYVALLGHNGSGKSTLARHCNALLLPTSGSVLVAGRNSSDPAQQRAIRDTVGMIFQNPDNQLIATVVEDDIAWALTVRGYSRAVIADRVERSTGCGRHLRATRVATTTPVGWTATTSSYRGSTGLTPAVYHRRRGNSPT